MEFWKLVNKNKHLVMPGVLAFALISLLTITQNVSKLVLIVIWGYILIMAVFFIVNFYKNKSLYVYSKEDSDGKLTWKLFYRIMTLLLMLFSFIVLMEIFNFQNADVYFQLVSFTLTAVVELEIILFFLMSFLKWKSRYLYILLFLMFVTFLNNGHFVNLLFGSVGILFVAQFILSDNFFDYLKNHYSKYDMITIKRYMKANKTRFLAFSYLITFSVNVIFMIKLLLPGEIKGWLKNMILNAYNWITRTKTQSEIADSFLINTVILGIIILFYTLIDSFLKGKLKKTKASILKYMRENLQEKKVENIHG